MVASRFCRYTRNFRARARPFLASQRPVLSTVDADVARPRSAHRAVATAPASPPPVATPSRWVERTAASASVADSPPAAHAGEHVADQLEQVGDADDHDGGHDPDLEQAGAPDHDLPADGVGVPPHRDLHQAQQQPKTDEHQRHQPRQRREVDGDVVAAVAPPQALEDRAVDPSPGPEDEVEEQGQEQDVEQDPADHPSRVDQATTGPVHQVGGVVPEVLLLGRAPGEGVGGGDGVLAPRLPRQPAPGHQVDGGGDVGPPGHGGQVVGLVRAGEDAVLLHRLQRPQAEGGRPDPTPREADPHRARLGRRPRWPGCRGPSSAPPPSSPPFPRFEDDGKLARGDPPVHG